MTAQGVERGRLVPLPGRRLAAIGAVLLGTLVLMALLAPVLAPYAPDARVAPPFADPSAAHPLGTNDVGQDLLTDLIYGARVSLFVGVSAAVIGTVVGTLVGLAAGVSGGVVDALLMRLVDMVLALPLIPLTLAIGVFLGPGLGTQVLVIAAVTWAGTARELRAQILSDKERDDVQAARAMGAGRVWIARRYLFGSVVPLVVPQFVLAAKTAILLEATLSFLGLGDPTARSWGTTLSLAYDRSAFLTGAWVWWVIPPGVAIAATVLALALIGFALEERVRRALEPRREPEPAEEPPEDPAEQPAAGPSSGDRPEPDPAGPPRDAVLAVHNLRVTYRTTRRDRTAVRGVSQHVGAGETVALVGESGSGKSTLVGAALALLRPPGTVTGGTCRLAGHDVATLDEERLRRLRGGEVALVPQDAMSALNPLHRVGDQIVEAIRLHQPLTRRSARPQARELLEEVGIPADRVRAWPHELSGGMRQRVVLAMALANRPALLVADEPTNGLDVVRQAALVRTLLGLRARHGLAMLLVTHDLPLALRLADRLVVMRHGTVVEEGQAADLRSAPRHDYTRQLLEAVPRLPAATGSG